MLATDGWPPESADARSGGGLLGISPPAVSARIRSATSFMVIRWSIAVRWIHLNACGSVIPYVGHQRALGPLDRLAGLQPVGQAGDLRLQGGDLGVRDSAISIAGTRSLFWNGFTR